MSIENRLLSKVINEAGWAELRSLNVTVEDFYLQAGTYQFIANYYRDYHDVPSYAEVVRECPDFDYHPEVPDKLAFLVRKLKSDNARRRSYELLQKQASTKFNELQGAEFINWLCEEANKIKAVSDVSLTTGTNFATNGAERKQMYLDSKEKVSEEIIPTAFDSLNEWLGGGFCCGDYVLIQGFVNRGKSTHIKLF